MAALLPRNLALAGLFPLELLSWAVLVAAFGALAWLVRRCEDSLKQASQRLVMEQGLLRQVCETVRQLDTEPLHAAERASSPAEWLLEQCKLTSEGQRQSVVARRIIRMGTIARTRMSGEFLLSELLSRGEDLHPQEARFIAATLVFIALLGTVTSMGLAVYSLPSFGGGSPDYSALNQLKLHILIAFIVTAMGIAGTVYAAWKNNAFTQEQDRFLLALEEFSLDQLAPLLLGRPEIAELERLATLQGAMLRSSENLTQVLVTAGRNMNQAIEQMRVGAEQRAHQVQTALLEGATQFSADIQVASGALTHATSRLVQVSEQSFQTVPAALQAATDLERLSREASQSLERSTGTLQSAVVTFDRFLQELPPQLGILQTATGRMADATEGLRKDQMESRHNLQATLQAIRNTAEHLDALQTIMQATYRDVQTSFQQVEASFKQNHTEFVDALGGISAATREQVTRLGDGQAVLLDGIGTRFESAAEKYNTLALETLQDSCGSWVRLMDAADPTVTNLERASSSLREAVDTLGESARALGHAPLPSASGAPAPSVEAALSAVRTAMAEVQAGVREMKAATAELSGVIRQLPGQVAAAVAGQAASRVPSAPVPPPAPLRDPQAEARLADALGQMNGVLLEIRNGLASRPDPAARTTRVGTVRKKRSTDGEPPPPGTPEETPPPPVEAGNGAAPADSAHGGIETDTAPVVPPKPESFGQKLRRWGQTEVRLDFWNREKH
jgi:hypothetical protein